MKKKKTRKITSLFVRILRSLFIPLVFLLGVFIFLFMSREYDMQQRYHLIEGKMRLESFDREFEPILADSKILSDKKALSQQIRKMQEKLSAEAIDIINPTTNHSIVESPSRSKKSWASISVHQTNIQTSLSLKRKNTPYHIWIDKNQGKFYGYIPFKDTQANQYYVAVGQFSLFSFQQALAATSKIIILMCIIVFTTIFLIALRLSIRIIRPLQMINRAFREMLTGNLGKQVTIRTGDEIELLASNFNKMSQAMLVMTHQASDSNPLTKLPGNQEIMNEMNLRINEERSFVFFHIDIDHFKAYNDQYGLSRGDDVLTRTSEILREVLKKAGQDANFVGHQGGDDFILVLEPSKAEIIAQIICDQFDELIKEFYNPEDLSRGYFVGADTRNVSLSGEAEIKRHPLMSVSLAGVSNLKGLYKSPQEILERAVSIKKKVKKIPYSVFLIEE